MFPAFNLLHSTFNIITNYYIYGKKVVTRGRDEEYGRNEWEEEAKET